MCFQAGMAARRLLCLMGGMASDEDPAGKVRVPLLLTPAEVKELDDWQFANRHRTRTAAIKALMRAGYEAAKADRGKA